MSYTLGSVLQDVAAFINQDPANETGSALTSEVQLANLAQNEWADTYQWSQLKTRFIPTFTYSGSSIGLQSNFKKIMTPLYDVSQSPPVLYQQIDSQDRFTRDSSEYYFYTQGNEVTGKSLFINPPLASGASLSLDVQIYPSSLATTNDIVTCPSRPFMVARVIAKVLAARSDPRFPTLKAESDELLDAMIEEEATPSGGEINITKDYYTSRGFRIGS